MKKNLNGWDWMVTKIKVEQHYCHVCKHPYKEMDVGKKHLHATCEVCERRDEVGLVWQSRD